MCRDHSRIRVGGDDSVAELIQRIHLKGKKGSVGDQRCHLVVVNKLIAHLIPEPDS